MKTLFFLNSPSKGGLEIYALKTAEALKEKGLNVHIYLHKDSTLKIQNLQRLKLKEIFLKKWDIIHFFRSQDIIFSIFLRADKKFFTNMMGLSISKKDIYHKFLYRKIDKIFAISKAIKKELEKNLPVTKEKIKLLYPGVDINYFKKDLSLRKEFREKLGIKENEILISNTSRFDRKKGQKEAVVVFNKLLNDHKNIKLVFQGAIEDKKYFEELKKIADRNIIFLEFAEDTKPLLSASDIYIFPSHAEALGFSLIEAMSMELPCVAFSERAIPEIIDNDINGFLVSDKNLEEMKEKIEILIKNTKIRKKLGEKARKKIIEKFNFEKYIKNLLKFYNKNGKTMANL